MTCFGPKHTFKLSDSVKDKKKYNQRSCYCQPIKHYGLKKIRIQKKKSIKSNKNYKKPKKYKKKNKRLKTQTPEIANEV